MSADNGFWVPDASFADGAGGWLQLWDVWWSGGPVALPHRLQGAPVGDVSVGVSSVVDTLEEWTAAEFVVHADRVAGVWSDNVPYGVSGLPLPAGRYSLSVRVAAATARPLLGPVLPVGMRFAPRVSAPTAPGTSSASAGTTIVPPDDFGAFDGVSIAVWHVYWPGGDLALAQDVLGPLANNLDTTLLAGQLTAEDAYNGSALLYVEYTTASGWATYSSPPAHDVLAAGFYTIEQVQYGPDSSLQPLCPVLPQGALFAPSALTKPVFDALAARVTALETP